MRRYFSLSFLIVAFLWPQRGHSALPLNIPGINNPIKVSPAPQKSALTKEQILSLKEQLVQELIKSKQVLEQASPDTPQESLQALRNQVNTLEKLDKTYDKILDAFKNRDQLLAEKSSYEEKLNIWKTGVAPKDFPVTFAQMDKLRSQVLEGEKKEFNLQKLISAFPEDVSEARHNFQKAEAARRRAKENLESNRGSSATSGFEQALTEAQLNSQLAEAQLQYDEAKLEASQIALENLKMERDLLQIQFKWLQERVKFTQEDLNKEIAPLDKEEERIRSDLEGTKTELGKAEEAYAEVQTQKEKSGEPSAALDQELEARFLNKNYLESKIQVLNAALKGISDLKELWEHRFELANGEVKKGQLEDWQDESSHSLERYKQQEEFLHLQLNTVRDQLAQFEENLNRSGDKDASTLKWIKIKKESYLSYLNMLQDYQPWLSSVMTLEGKFLSEISEKLSTVTFGDRLKALWVKVEKIWTYEITTVDDAPITVQKIFSALILIVLGSLLARWLSHLLGKRLLPRFQTDPSVVAGLQTLAFYLLLIFFVILALDIVNVPLTIFAVLGGAVALGVGFGSQTIVKNFISGLILIMERPIRIGDLIEVENNLGVVEHIGARSTRIRLVNNIHLIVPNSTLLEKNVINWMLADDIIRIPIRVSVAYGSSPDQVMSILRKVVESHERVLEFPAPLIYFSEFGENALIFEVYFNIRMRSIAERRTIESEIRLALEKEFRQAGIRFPFPQRDVHLDSSGTIDVKLV
jgi:potassium-dependent mechanosensitive channel